MNPNNFDLDDDLLRELSKVGEDLEVHKRNEEIRRKRAEGGKLGGRPKKNNSKKKQINIKLSENEYLTILETAKAYKISPADLLRRSGLGVPLPDGKRNEILLEFRTNFKRIANIFRSDIWDENEKKYFKNELQKVIFLINENIK